MMKIPTVTLLCVAFICISVLIFFKVSACQKTSTFENLKETDWIAEQEDNMSEFTLKDDTIEMVSPQGQTLWYKERLSGNYIITYKACVVVDDGPFDRLSDLNCFWAASAPANSGGFWELADWRKGNFPKYYSLNLYYVGFGGNHNSTTRFRKYDGDYAAYVSSGKKPDVIKEYTDSAHLLKPNKWYEIQIAVQGKDIRFYVDNELFFELHDENRYDSGYFGFRGVKNHLRFTAFQIVRAN